MVTTRSQGTQDGMSPPEGEPQPVTPQPTCREIQLEQRNHVFQILNQSKVAVAVMDLQNITSILRIISTKRNI